MDNILFLLGARVDLWQRRWWKGYPCLSLLVFVSVRNDEIGSKKEQYKAQRNYNKQTEATSYRLRLLVIINGGSGDYGNGDGDGDVK